MKTTIRGESIQQRNPWTLVVLLLVFAAFSSGCQFLQNEFWTY